MNDSAALLLVLLFAAHFLGDFTPLSTARMQQAKSVGRPIAPIAAHAAVHAVLVAIAIAIATWPGTALAAAAVGVAFLSHLAIDWARGRLGAVRPGLSNPETQAFWSVLGLDQFAHAMVLLWIAVLVA